MSGCDFVTRFEVSVEGFSEGTGGSLGPVVDSGLVTFLENGNCVVDDVAVMTGVSE